MRNRAWGALGAATVIMTAANAWDHATDGCAQAGNGGALAAALADGGDDGSGDDSAEDILGAPETEAPEAQGAPEAAGDDGTAGVEAGGDDAGTAGGDDAGGPDEDSGTIVVIVDSGSGVTPSGEPDAAAEAGDVVVDAGTEAAGPTDAGTARETGAQQPSSGGLRLAPTGQTAPAGNPAGAAVGGAPTPVDDDSGAFFEDDAGVAGNWNNGAPPAIDLTPPRAELGCAGCSVPDAAGSGTLSWLAVALTLLARLARGLRRRRA